MQSEAVKDMVRDMEAVESLLGNKGRFVGDMVHISIKDLAKCIAAQSPASAVEVVTVEELANRLVIEGRSPDSAEVMLDHVHIGYWKARLERLAKMFPNGIRIIKPESE